jgi:hypothetical protein
MKKVTRIIGAICMMGLLTFVSTSCKKNQENGEMTINVVVSEYEEDGERAYIDPNLQFWWHEFDQVRVYNLAEEANADESATSVFTKIGNTTSTQTARFRGPSVGTKKAEGYRVFYPVKMVKNNDDDEMINATLWNENRQIFQVGKKQQYRYYQTTEHPHASMVDGNAMPMAINMESLTDAVNLKHVFGVASFLIRQNFGQNLVIDSIKLVDNFHNLTGDVSVKLTSVVAANMTYVSDQFFGRGEPGDPDYIAGYHGFTQEYVDGVVAPALANLGWMPERTGKEITLDCTYKHDDGETKGEALTTSNTEFAISLRPLALSEGFHLLVYIQGVEDPIDLDDTKFYRNNSQTLDYTWAIKPKTFKRYILRNTLESYLPTGK